MWWCGGKDIKTILKVRENNPQILQCPERATESQLDVSVHQCKQQLLAVSIGTLLSLGICWQRRASRSIRVRLRTINRRCCRVQLPLLIRVPIQMAHVLKECHNQRHQLAFGERLSQPSRKRPVTNHQSTHNNEDAHYYNTANF